MLTIAENPLLRPSPDKAQGELRTSTVLRRPSPRRRYLSAIHSRNAIKEISTLPATEESLHIVARGNFPLWSIVPAILALASPATIDALHIATLGFSIANATDLFSLIDAGKVKTTAIVASVYFERQNPAEWRVMFDGLTERGQQIAALRSHAKVIAIALSDGRRFAIESSANLRSCRNIEQITITQSSDLHGFHAKWIADVIGAARGSK